MLETVSGRIQAWTAGFTGSGRIAAVRTGHVSRRNVCDGHTGGYLKLWEDKAPAANSSDGRVTAKGKGFCGRDALADGKRIYTES